MELVKANKIRQSQADILFQEWKRKQEGGRGKSFSEKQVKQRLAFTSKETVVPDYGIV